ncbi:MAG: hypothetical protein AAFU03_06355, partial [Bacteroidota bacterium]
RIGLIMIGLIGLVMVATGILKMFGADEAAKGFGNPIAPYILAVVQFLIATAIALPRTRLLGVILAASYIGGITAFSWLHEEELPIIGIVLNTILYIGAALYRPGLMDGRANMATSA